MDRLFIKVDSSNTPINGIHPSFESNLKANFPDHDWTSDSPPLGYKKFQRVSPPVLKTYEVFDPLIGEDISMAFTHNGLEYKYFADEDTVKDVWHVRDMTAEEKQAKIDAKYAEWNNYHPWAFDESICEFVVPDSYPGKGEDDPTIYEYKNSNGEWVQYPTDGKNYNWDNTKEEWVEVT